MNHHNRGNPVQDYRARSLAAKTSSFTRGSGLGGGTSIYKSKYCWNHTFNRLGRGKHDRLSGIYSMRHLIASNVPALGMATLTSCSRNYPHRFCSASL